MSYKESYPVTATTSLEGRQYKAVSAGGTLSIHNESAIGILQNKPQLNEVGEVVFWGRTQVVAGDTLVAGSKLKVSSGGWVVACTSGDSSIGVAPIATTSGSQVEAIVNFVGVTKVTSWA